MTAFGTLTRGAPPTAAPARSSAPGSTRVVLVHARRLAGSAARCPGCGKLDSSGWGGPRGAKEHPWVVVANVYEGGRWNRTERWHPACYADAGEPHGQPARRKSAGVEAEEVSDAKAIEPGREPQTTESAEGPASKDDLPEEPIAAEPEAVITAVARHFGLRPEDVLSGRRDARAVTARQVGMYLCREFAGHPLTEIAAFFRRDHTTVGHGVQRIRDRRVGDPRLSASVEEIAASLRSGSSCTSVEIADRPSEGAAAEGDGRSRPTSAPFRCGHPGCGEGAPTGEELAGHARAAHPRWCHVCARAFESPAERALHQGRAHGIREAPPTIALRPREGFPEELEEPGDGQGLEVGHPDLEIEAIGLCCRALAPVTPGGRRRVLDYLAQRFVVDAG